MNRIFNFLALAVYALNFGMIIGHTPFAGMDISRQKIAGVVGIILMGIVQVIVRNRKKKLKRGQPMNFRIQGDGNDSGV